MTDGLEPAHRNSPTRLGKYSRRPSTRRISFAVGAHAAGRRRIFIAPPSATENGFLLVREPIEYLPSLVGQNVSASCARKAYAECAGCCSSTYLCASHDDSVAG